MFAAAIAECDAEPHRLSPPKSSSATLAAIPLPRYPCSSGTGTAAWPANGNGQARPGRRPIGNAEVAQRHWEGFEGSVLTGPRTIVEPVDPDRDAADIYAAGIEGEEPDRIWDYLGYGPFAGTDAVRDWLGMVRRVEGPALHGLSRPEHRPARRHGQLHGDQAGRRGGRDRQHLVRPRLAARHPRDRGAFADDAPCAGKRAATGGWNGSAMR